MKMLEWLLPVRSVLKVDTARPRQQLQPLVRLLGGLCCVPLGPFQPFCNHISGYFFVHRGRLESRSSQAGHLLVCDCQHEPQFFHLFNGNNRTLAPLCELGIRKAHRELRRHGAWSSHRFATLFMSWHTYTTDILRHPRKYICQADQNIGITLTFHTRLMCWLPSFFI